MLTTHTHINVKILLGRRSNFYLVTVQIHKSWECTIDFVFKPVIHTTTIAQWGEIFSKLAYRHSSIYAVNVGTKKKNAEAKTS